MEEGEEDEEEGWEEVVERLQDLQRAASIGEVAKDAEWDAQALAASLEAAR